MIREISKLNVYYHDRLVGMIAISPKGNCIFQYDKKWLTDGFSISPLKLPLTNQLFEALQHRFTAISVYLPTACRMAMVDIYSIRCF